MIEYENLSRLNQPFLAAYAKKFKSVMERGWFVLGEEVSDFERDFAAYCGSHHCAGVANGLDALILSLKALNFQLKKEVLVPSNTYIATILSILHCGLKPVLVEPDIETYNIDPRKILEAVTKETVAIVVVHLYGKCCAMEEIKAIADAHDLKIIEDCAQAHGATFKGKKAGTFGDFGAFSFYPTKNLGALGDGGGVICNNEEQIQMIKMLRNYGSDKKYYNEVVGYNSRLDELQAAFLSIKLSHLDSINDHKKRLASIYDIHLKGDFVKPVTHPDYNDVYHIYAIRHPHRDKLKAYLLENKIKTEIHYPIPPHRQKAMKGICNDMRFPIAEEIHDTVLSLPISYFHTEDEIMRVVDAMNKF
ncbi:MAG: DegT/DnrJ/EryC1/StrS family aminotransferase [Cyclobacteriaceae bacterium]|nr:DegT/DnrJ/EryC1/StrS family aminotransferase [Cyclobacteriaceae bacterium]